jgi:hypothetical protein
MKGLRLSCIRYICLPENFWPYLRLDTSLKKLHGEDIIGQYQPKEETSSGYRRLALASIFFDRAN